MKFVNEEGVGNGPTREFFTVFAEELQRRELHLWHDETDDDCSLECAVRMLNNPKRGPEETTKGDEIISGAVLWCSGCKCFNIWSCEVDCCLLSLDRERSGLITLQS